MLGDSQTKHVPNFFFLTKKIIVLTLLMHGSNKLFPVGLLPTSSVVVVVWVYALREMAYKALVLLQSLHRFRRSLLRTLSQRQFDERMMPLLDA